jgi:hypothetical protein
MSSCLGSEETAIRRKNNSTNAMRAFDCPKNLNLQQRSTKEIGMAAEVVIR